MEASIWKPNDETLNLKKNEKLIQKNVSAFNGKSKYELRNKTTVPIWMHRECRKAARKNKILIHVFLSLTTKGAYSIFFKQASTQNPKSKGNVDREY